MQPDDAAGDGRLPAARLADEPERLARRERQRDDSTATSRPPCSGNVTVRSSTSRTDPRRRSLGGKKLGAHAARQPVPMDAGRPVRGRRTLASRRAVERASRIPASRGSSAGGSCSPAGSASRSGSAPGIGSGTATGSSRSTIASSSPSVYGWSGSASTSGVRPRLDDPARVHDADVLAELPDHRQVVADEDDREAEPRSQVFEQLEHLRLHRHVERRRRLVAEEHRRLGGERDRDQRRAGASRPRAGAGRRARAGPGSGIPTIRSSSIARSHDCRFERRRGRAAAPRRSASPTVLKRIERAERILEDHRHPPAQRPANVADSVRELGSVEPHDAAVHARRRGKQGHDCAQRQALPRTGLADEPESPAGRDLERDAVDGREAAARARHRDRQVLDGEGGLDGKSAHDGRRTSREPVADQREPESRDDDRDAGKRRERPVGRQEVLAVADHGPPVGGRRLDAEAEVAERDHRDDHEHDVAHRVDDALRDRVGKDVPPEDAQVGQPPARAAAT